MSEKPTQITVIGDQRRIFAGLDSLAEMFDHLPPAYITIQANSTPTGMLLDSYNDFELWRQSLGIPPEAVEWHPYSRGSWMAMRGTVRGVEIELTCHTLVDPAAAATPPRVDAERRFEARRAHLIAERAKLNDGQAVAEPSADAAAPVADDSAVPEMAAVPGGAA